MPLPIWFTDNVFKDRQKQVVTSNINIELPFKTAFIQADPLTTVDIEDGSMVTVDDGCVLIITDPPPDRV